MHEANPAQNQNADMNGAPGAAQSGAATASDASLFPLTEPLEGPSLTEAQCAFFNAQLPADFEEDPFVCVE